MTTITLARHQSMPRLTWRKGIAAAAIATALVEVLGALFGWSTTVFLSPLKPIIGSAADLLGLIVRGFFFGMLFILLAPCLPGGGTVLKAVALAAAVWLASLAIAALEGGDMLESATAELLSRGVIVAVYGVLLGAALRLMVPEEWPQDGGDPNPGGRGDDNLPRTCR